jgi:hypothetical protein
VEFDRPDASASAEINYHELSVALRQRQHQGKAISPNRHRLDPGTAGNIDRRIREGASRVRDRPAARGFADDGRDKDCESDDEHNAHHNDQDLEPTHAFATRPENIKWSSLRAWAPGHSAGRSWMTFARWTVIFAAYVAL